MFSLSPCSAHGKRRECTVCVLGDVTPRCWEERGKGNSLGRGIAWAGQDGMWSQGNGCSQPGDAEELL